MTETNMLTLCFLERRDYLHGTTLFDALRAKTSGGDKLRFKLARMIKTDRVRVEDSASGGFDAAKYAATLSWSAAENDGRSLGVVPEQPSASPVHKSYDETAIVSKASFDDKSATLRWCAGESFVRMLVALNKAFLFRVLAPVAPGQWLFTRLELERDIERFDQLALHLRSQVGLSAVWSAIAVDGKPAGALMFSWLAK